MKETADQWMARIIRAHGSPEFIAAYFVRCANELANPSNPRPAPPPGRVLREWQLP